MIFQDNTDAAAEAVSKTTEKMEAAEKLEAAAGPSAVDSAVDALSSGDVSGIDIGAIMAEVGEMLTFYGMSVLGALVILFIGLWISKKVRSGVMNAISKTGKIDETVGRFLASIAYYGAVLITIIAVLSQFGIQTTSFVAIIGAMGLAIGLAMQGTLGHVASGVMLLIFRPFKIGQVVNIAGETGTVKAITLFTTEMDTPDNVRIIIPNGAVWGSSVTNFSHNDKRRVDFVFGIGYGDDIAKAMEAIRGCLNSDDRIHGDPEHVVVVSNLNDSSVDITVRVWSDAADYWGIKFDMTRAVKEAFDRDGIDIPYPQSVVHHKND